MLFYPFDCEAKHVEGVGEFIQICRGEIDELLEPEQWDFHENCLKKRTSLSMKCFIESIP